MKLYMYLLSFVTVDCIIVFSEKITVFQVDIVFLSTIILSCTIKVIIITHDT